MKGSRKEGEVEYSRTGHKDLMPGYKSWNWKWNWLFANCTTIGTSWAPVTVLSPHCILPLYVRSHLPITSIQLLPLPPLWSFSLRSPLFLGLGSYGKLPAFSASDRKLLRNWDAQTNSIILKKIRFMIEYVILNEIFFFGIKLWHLELLEFHKSQSILLKSASHRDRS